MTGGAARKPQLAGGDKGRNKKTDRFLAGKPRPLGGKLHNWSDETAAEKFLREGDALINGIDGDMMPHRVSAKKEAATFFPECLG